MAIGDEAKLGINSYVALGKESTFGTYASATSAIEALSCTFRTDIESEKLETFGIGRSFTKRVQKNKTIAGSLEKYANSEEDPLLWLVAMGGTLTSSSLTSAADHSITTGDFNTGTTSLSFNVRKGDTHTWRYSGGRINTLTLSGNVNEVVKLTAEFIFKDSTQVSDDIFSSLTITGTAPFVYTEGTYKYANNESNAATTTSEEKIQSFELTLNNNLEEGRELGSNILSVLPAKRREIELTVTQRFDTTTAYNRFIQATAGAVELLFSGQSISAEYNNEMTIRLPNVYVNSPDPEIGGPDEILSSEITFDVVGTTTGRDIGVTIRNATAAY